jgi:hypothetical protein
VPNFYADNPDLRRRIASAPWSTLLPPLEEDFKDPHETAPRSLAEAVDQIETILDLVGELCGSEIAPLAAEVDRKGARLEGGRVVYAEETQRQLRLLSEAGLLGFTLPREHGGLNLPTLAYTAAVEMVARADASLMTLFALQGCAETIHRFGDEALRRRFLPRLCSGEVMACMALTEPNAGSDLGAVAARATRDGAGWRIDGSKCFITNGGADLLLVLARTGDKPGGPGLSLFAVERGPGVTVTKLEEKLGIHGSPTAVVNFDGARGSLLGNEGDGLYRCTLSLLHNVRLEVAAQAVGIAQAAQAQAARYATERQQFRRPIDRFAPVRNLLFRNALQLEAARAIVYSTAALVDRRKGARKRGGAGGEEERFERLAALLTPLAKYHACEIANDVTSRALQVHGGYGYTRDYPVERHLRDARIANIYEGTSEIQVGSMIQPLVDGGIDLLFAEALADAVEPPACAGALEHLRRTHEALGRAAAVVRSADRFAQQGWARRVVDVTADLLAGLVFLRDAAHDGRSAILARVHAAETRARADAGLQEIFDGVRDGFSDETFEAVIAPYRGNA